MKKKNKKPSEISSITLPLNQYPIPKIYPQAINFFGEKELIGNYDPRKLVCKCLKELIPSIKEGSEKQTYPSHYINYYEVNKNFLLYFEGNYSMYPIQMKSPYSDFEKYVGKLNFTSSLKTDSFNQSKVELYQNNFGLKYILKTFWYFYNPDIKNTDSILLADTFISKRFNEYAYLRLFSTCPYSVKPVEFSLIYLKPIKIIISELLETYGGEPLIKLIPISDTNLLFQIFVQIINGLKFLECLGLQHNDIKGENIVFERQLNHLIIRFIDFDIGKNESITLKNTAKAEIYGYSSFYVAPEIFQGINKNYPSFLKINPWKCQVYSMGILILQLIGFFHNSINIKEIDKYKQSQSEYEKFKDILKKHSSNISDNLMQNVIVILNICLSYNPEERLTANELVQLIPNLQSQNSNLIETEYRRIIQNRKKENQNIISKKGSNNLKVEEITNQSLSNIVDPNQEINQLIKENKLLQKEIMEKNSKLLEATNALHEIKCKLNAEEKKMKEQTDINFQTSREIIMIKNENLEKDQIITKLKDELVKYNELKEIVKREEEIKKEISNLSEELSALKKRNSEFLDEFSNIRIKIEKDKNIDISSCDNYSKLCRSLYESYNQLFEKFNKLQRKYVENLDYENGVYAGPVINKNTPHGIGMIKYSDINSKFIGEFENGKVKYDIGFTVDEFERYTFGRFIKGVALSPCFSLGQFPKYKGEKYYFGETKNNVAEGKGKIVYTNGEFYEGEWKNDKKDGYGKYFYTDGSWFEGEWKKGMKEGRGKIIYSDLSYEEAEWKNNQKNWIIRKVPAKGNYNPGIQTNFSNNREYNQNEIKIVHKIEPIIARFIEKDYQVNEKNQNIAKKEEAKSEETQERIMGKEINKIIVKNLESDPKNGNNLLEPKYEHKKEKGIDINLYIDNKLSGVLNSLNTKGKELPLALDENINLNSLNKAKGIHGENGKYFTEEESKNNNGNNNTNTPFDKNCTNIIYDEISKNNRANDTNCLSNFNNLPLLFESKK